MIRKAAPLLVLLGLSAACTLLVEQELARHTTQKGGAEDGGGDGGADGGEDGGVCADFTFDDGVHAGGVRFKGGIGAVAFRGPAQMPPGDTDPSNYPSAFAAVTADGVMMGTALEGHVGTRGVSLTPRPDFLAVAPGHVFDGTPCAEVLAGKYDALHDRSSWTLFGGGCLNSDSLDGGVTTGEPAGASLGWARDSVLLGSTVLLAWMQNGNVGVCDESALLSCKPPKTPLARPMSAAAMEALYPQNGKPLWAIASTTDSGDGQTQLYRSDFSAVSVPDGGTTIPWGNQLAPIVSDIMLAIRPNGGFDAVLFDVSGTVIGSGSLNIDAAEINGLTLSSLHLPGVHVVRLAWVDGAHRGQVADLDVSDPNHLVWSGPATVCGVGPASFAAALNSTTVLVKEGNDLTLRPTPVLHVVTQN